MKLGQIYTVIYVQRIRKMYNFASNAEQIVQKLALLLVLTFYTSSVDHIEPLENLDSIKMTQRVRT